MFPPDPTARASFKSGTAYAVAGGDGWVYYGQVTAVRDFGFFRFRSRGANELQTALASDIMCRIGVAIPTVGDALRHGSWRHLGMAPLHAVLASPSIYVQWPLFSTTVTVRRLVTRHRSAQNSSYETTIDDPEIQHYEIAAAWHARHHVPPRLPCDFGAEPCDPHIGGPVWRQRRMELESSRRHPDRPNRFGLSCGELLHRYGPD